MKRINTIKLYFVFIFIFIQALCALSYDEWYPFSRFPMYKGLSRPKNIVFCETYVHYLDRDGNRQVKKYHKVGSHDSLYEFRYRHCDTQKKIDHLIKNERAYLQNIISDYRKGLKLRKKEILKKIEIKALYWDTLTQSNIESPDKEVIIYEKNFNTSL